MRVSFGIGGTIVPMGNELFEIFLASDHNGNAARAYSIRVLKRDFPSAMIVDLGPSEEEGKVDYPILAERLALRMKDPPAWKTYGILICGTGTGMSIAANRFPWIRAGIGTDRATGELMREHNDCNVLVLGQWRNSLSQIDEIIKAFLTTPYGGGRHDHRLSLLADLNVNP